VEIKSELMCLKTNKNGASEKNTQVPAAAAVAGASVFLEGAVIILFLLIKSD